MQGVFFSLKYILASVFKLGAVVMSFRILVIIVVRFIYYYVILFVQDFNTSFHLCKICTVYELMLGNNMLIVSNAESYYGFY